MERLLNIDNGGTLTDICVWDGQDFTYAKTLSTPFDPSVSSTASPRPRRASSVQRTWRLCYTAPSASGTPRPRAPTPSWSARARAVSYTHLRAHETDSY